MHGKAIQESPNRNHHHRQVLEYIASMVALHKREYGRNIRNVVLAARKLDFEKLVTLPFIENQRNGSWVFIMCLLRKISFWR